MGDFNATFDASVHGKGDLLNSVDFDWLQLKFSAPKKASSDLTCISHASVGKTRSAFQITLNGATVDRVTHTRADFHTLFIRLPVGPIRALKKFVDSLDLCVIDVVKGNVDAWFNRSMSGDLIEEYYRNSTTSSPSLRFVISGDLEERLTNGSLVNIALRLVGVQFRSQYFTCVWKIVSLEEAAEPLKIVAGDFEGGFGFFPDDEEDPEEDNDLAYPSEDQRIALVQAETRRLSSVAEGWQAKADSFHAAWVNALDKIEYIKTVSQRLTTIGNFGFAEAYAEAESITDELTSSEPS